jgi:hypothetical protein
MSLEQKIDDLTHAITTLIGVLAQKPETVRPAPAPVAAPIVAAPAPIVTPPAPVPAPVPAPAPAMPPPPTFAAPDPASTAALPFSDTKSLIGWVMGVYQALGPAKGAQIQQVLVGIGCANINDVKPEQYAALYAGVEALKAQA